MVSYPETATTALEAVIHPDLEQEQAYVDRAYACLEASRDAALQIQNLVEVGAGGTHQARYERDVIKETVSTRLAQLEIGDASLCFGRLDFAEGDERFYIGRIAVWDENQDPVLVDWRAPVAEPFYRATGSEPMGLVRRRHFACRGRDLLGIEDEFFGGSARERGVDDLLGSIKGEQTLVATLEAARTGRLGDIVATIQSEQDEIIRSPLPGIVVVQGGPGTGKTVVALHRAAYLLYTHRFPLEGQGVLVLGPNRVFLTYIEQVLPSLGEAGIEIAALGDLISGAIVRGSDPEPVARVKGDLRIVDVLWRAVRDRERALRDDLVVGYGLGRLRLTVDDSRRIVADVRRRTRTHNAGRRLVETAVYETLAASGRDDADPEEVRERLDGTLELRETLEWMWPVLTPWHFLNDLYGSPALLRSAANGRLDADELDALHRPRSDRPADAVWTADDVPLLDEARALLGAYSRRSKKEAIRTYGHIVVDEAQDLSPMQLRMVARRSLNGSMTVVGDIAQATGAWAHDDWDSVLEHLPDRREPRFAELTVGYRLPAPTMEVAARVLAHAAPGLTPPKAVRQDGVEPRLVRAGEAPLASTVAEVVREELDAVGAGNLAVIAPGSLVGQLSDALTEAGMEHGLAYARALESQITVVPVGLVKGLELDAGVVVEPARIVAEQEQGLRALYVALTRSTRRLSVVHADALPAVLDGAFGRQHQP